MEDLDWGYGSGLGRTGGGLKTTLTCTRTNKYFCLLGVFGLNVEGIGVVRCDCATFGGMGAWCRLIMFGIIV